MDKPKKKPLGERGQSLVEFAVMLVILLVLLLGIADFGRAFLIYLSLRDAAQEGAVYASICPTDVTEIQNRSLQSSTGIVDLSTDPNVSFECFYIGPGGETSCSGAPTPGYGVKVRVTYSNYQLMTPLLATFTGTDTFTMHAEATDSILRDSCP
jgi:Flp pilus assembly protein TadG